MMSLIDGGMRYFEFEMLAAQNRSSSPLKILYEASMFADLIDPHSHVGLGYDLYDAMLKLQLTNGSYE